MNLPLDQLDLLGTPADLLAGAPMQLAIDSIIEDPEQPRNEFDPEGLAELAASIKERGVLQPISLASSTFLPSSTRRRTATTK